MHRPSVQIPSSWHSSLSLQEFVSRSLAWPSGHSQVKEPGVLTHFPPSHKPGIASHSLMSDQLISSRKFLQFSTDSSWIILSLTNALALVSFQVAQLAVEPRGTPFAGMAPALAHGGAAQLPRAHDTLKIRQALAVLHFRVTRPGSEKRNNRLISMIGRQLINV